MNSTPTPRPLGADSLVWKVGGDWTALLGGGRALIMQVGHPVVATGIDQFSTYRDNPWKRLVGTLELYLATVFGGEREAVRAGADLRALHRRIKGVDAAGNRYHSLDPEPYAWVHATLVDSLIETVDRFQRPLGQADREQIYAEMSQVGRLYGLRPRDLPADWNAFVAYREEMIATRLVVSDTLRAVVESIINLPSPPWLRVPDPLWSTAVWPACRISELVTVGMLPESLREGLDLKWNPRRAQALALLQRGVRRAFPKLPARVRLMPPAYNALRGGRLAGSTAGRVGSASGSP